MLPLQSVHVDDAWCIDDAGPQADADWAALTAMFKFNVKEESKQFLNMNVTVIDETKVKLSMEAYILTMADEMVPDWKTWPKLDMPGTDKLQRDYDGRCSRSTCAGECCQAQVLSYQSWQVDLHSAVRACRRCLLHQPCVSCTDVSDGCLGSPCRSHHCLPCSDGRYWCHV